MELQKKMLQKRKGLYEKYYYRNRLTGDEAMLHLRLRPDARGLALDNFLKTNIILDRTN